MKKTIAAVLLLGLTAFTTKYGAPSVEMELQVSVSGIKNSEGNVHLLVFNQPIGFPANPAKAYKHVKTKAVNGGVTVRIAAMPHGTYSIVAFHDRNSNGQLDKSWWGSPKEDYGFSNIRGEFCGMPSFQQTSFVFNPEKSAVSIQLTNVK